MTTLTSGSKIPSKQSTLSLFLQPDWVFVFKGGLTRYFSSPFPSQFVPGRIRLWVYLQKQGQIGLDSSPHAPRCLDVKEFWSTLDQIAPYSLEFISSAKNCSLTGYTVFCNWPCWSFCSYPDSKALSENDINSKVKRGSTDFSLSLNPNTCPELNDHLN